MFSLYPEHTVVEEEVIAECHSGAQFQSVSEDRIQFSRASFITFARAYAFLKACGTQFKPFPALKVEGMPWLNVKSNQLDEALINVYQEENQSFQGKVDRDSHSAKGLYTKTK